MLQICLVFLAITSLLMWACSPLKAEDTKNLMDAYQPAVYKNAANESLPYRLLKPLYLDQGEQTPKNKKYPLVIFLHGLGERGDDNVKQLVHGAGDFAKPEIRRKYPCFVVAPQCPTTTLWIEPKTNLGQWGIPLSEKPSPAMRLVLELVDQLAAELPVDADRIYITGLSMGGFGTWDAISRRPDLFAAAVPICGGGDPAQAPKLKELPIWAFHGEKDSVVPPSRTVTMIDALRAAGGSPKMTLYPNVQHNSWAQTYSDPEVMAWLFSQKKSGKGKAKDN